MTAEAVEGEVREVGLTVIPEQAVERLDETATPESMVSLAARMATALADIVEKKNLYATIQGKKYPQVEAWMTIGRMDNVAAREVRGGITRVEGGGFEAEVELIRLSDGMTVGYGSAMCGTPGDSPWEKRPVHVQRSMAVTRATSRAFRQRYSWIMALAGYEPTPADEMPGAPEPAPRQHPGLVNGDPPARPPLERTTHENGLVGKVATSGGQDFELHPSPDGYALPFRVKEGNRVGQIVVAQGPLAEALYPFRDSIMGERVTVWGRFSDESFDKVKDDVVETITYKVLHLERIQTADWTLPAETPTAPAPVVDDDLSDLDF